MWMPRGGSSGNGELGGRQLLQRILERSYIRGLKKSANQRRWKELRETRILFKDDPDTLGMQTHGFFPIGDERRYEAY